MALKTQVYSDDVMLICFDKIAVMKLSKKRGCLKRQPPGLSDKNRIALLPDHHFVADCLIASGNPDKVYT